MHRLITFPAGTPLTRGRFIPNEVHMFAMKVDNGTSAVVGWYARFGDTNHGDYLNVKSTKGILDQDIASTLDILHDQFTDKAKRLNITFTYPTT